MLSPPGEGLSVVKFGLELCTVQEGISIREFLSLLSGLIHHSP